MPSAASMETAQRLYCAYYGRPADSSGQQYWAGQIDSQGVSNSVLDSFGNSAEAQALYNSDLSGNFTIAYWLAFNRAPDADGLAYWVNQVNSGAYTFARAVWAFVSAASGNDLSAINGKVSTADAFTAASGTSLGEFGALYNSNTLPTVRNWMTYYGPNVAQQSDLNYVFGVMKNGGSINPAHPL